MRVTIETEDGTQEWFGVRDFNMTGAGCILYFPPDAGIESETIDGDVVSAVEETTLNEQGVKEILRDVNRSDAESTVVISRKFLATRQAMSDSTFDNVEVISNTSVNRRG